MDFKQVAGEIVEQSGNERWQATQNAIEAGLREAYQLGFLDGEARFVGGTKWTLSPDDDVYGWGV